MWSVHSAYGTLRSIDLQIILFIFYFLFITYYYLLFIIYHLLFIIYYHMQCDHGTVSLAPKFMVSAGE